LYTLSFTVLDFFDLTVLLFAALALGFFVRTSGAIDGLAVGFVVEGAAADSMGAGIPFFDGAFVGSTVGRSDGAVVGAVVGDFEGADVGCVEGAFDGAAVGAFVGVFEGAVVGTAVGRVDGDAVGAFEGGGVTTTCFTEGVPVALDVGEAGTLGCFDGAVVDSVTSVFSHCSGSIDSVTPKQPLST